MPPWNVQNGADAAKGAAAGFAGTVAADAAGGLDVAGRVAGDVLRGIFGGLPWEMSPGEIVHAVTGGLAGEPPTEAAATIVDVAVVLA